MQELGCSRVKCGPLRFLRKSSPPPTPFCIPTCPMASHLKIHSRKALRTSSHCVHLQSVRRWSPSLPDTSIMQTCRSFDTWLTSRPMTRDRARNCLNLLTQSTLCQAVAHPVKHAWQSYQCSLALCGSLPPFVMMNAASSIPMVYKTCLSWNRHAVLRLGFMLVLAMSESQIQSLFEFFLLSSWYLGILVSAEALNWCPGSGATGFWGLGIWHSKFEEGVFHFLLQLSRV